MNFSEYLASKRSGSHQVKLGQIPTASKVIQPEPPKPTLSQKKPFEKLPELTTQKRQPSPPDLFSKSLKTSPPCIMMDSSDDEVTQKPSNPVSLVKPSDVVTTFKKRVVPIKKYYPKIPDNLKDVKKHGEHKKFAKKVVGTKPVKKKAPAVVGIGPLTGQTMVVTGLLKGYDRDQLTEILRKYGARVTGSVSKKTTCLIHGLKLEDGRHYSEGNKFKKAKQLDTPIIDETQLDEMLIFIMGGQKPQENPIMETDPEVTAITRPDPSKFEQLWILKYQPKRLKEIVGNVQAIEKLVKWLEDWESVIYGGLRKDIRPVSHGRFDAQLNVNAATALISGPPGVGKTTAARLVSHGLNYKITELNASDARSRKAILEPLLSSSKSSCLTESGQVVRSILIMDEIDGMCSGDRGGIAALIQVIKQTKIPIICICNERMSPKLRAISNYSYDIRFNKPNKLQVASRMMEILHKEGVEADKSSIDQVVEASGCDVRQCLTILEMWSRQAQVLTPASAKFGVKMMSKDPLSMISHFDAAAKLLSKREMKPLRHRQKIDLVFIDFDLIPLVIQENYLNASTSEANQMKRISMAADSIAFGDVMNTFMRREKEWTLLAQYAQVAAIEPGMWTGNGIAFTKFPEWFGKQSTLRKNERMLRQVRNSMVKLISGNNESVLRDYIPLLYKIIIKTFKEGNTEETVKVMRMYNINPEMIKEHLIQLQFGSITCEEEYKNIETKDKSAVSKLYNLKFKSSLEKVKKKRDREIKDKVDHDIEDESGQEVEESESEESEVEVKPKVKPKTKR